MARHTLRSRADQWLESEECIIPHNALFVYCNGNFYRRRLNDGSLSRELYLIPLAIACDEERFEEID